MCNGKSEFHALMPKGQNAYKEILPYSVAMIQIGASEEEVVRYCDALGKLLEEATVLLRADDGN